LNYQWKIETKRIFLNEKKIKIQSLEMFKIQLEYNNKKKMKLDDEYEPS
jgi:hypothetical protein